MKKRTDEETLDHLAKLLRTVPSDHLDVDLFAQVIANTGRDVEFDHTKCDWEIYG